MKVEVPFILILSLPLAADTGNGRPKRLEPAARDSCSSAMEISLNTPVNAFLPEEYARYDKANDDCLIGIEKDYYKIQLLHYQRIIRSRIEWTAK